MATTTTETQIKYVTLWDLANTVRNLNGTRKQVLSGLQDRLGDDTCIKHHIMEDKNSTTAEQIVNDTHPMMPCKKCTNYAMADYDCPGYRSEALTSLRNMLNEYISDHQEQKTLPIVVLIQDRLPASYRKP